MLTTLIPSLIVGIVTAQLTVRWSLRKFYAERWWERKAEAYSRIVEALHKHKRYLEKKLDIELNPRDEDKREKGIEGLWAEANTELVRAVDFGAFIISEEAESIIKGFLNRRIGDPNDEPFSEILETDLTKVNKCLSEVKAAAKRDLDLPVVRLKRRNLKRR